MKKRIVVVGGYGTFGRRIAARLALDPAIECVVAGRSAKRAEHFAQSIGAQWAVVDIENTHSLEAALHGAFLTINASGPFVPRRYTIPEFCIKGGVHYLDVAASRAYVSGIAKLHKKAQTAGCMVVSGAGVVPAVSGILADILSADFDVIEEVQGVLALGGRQARGAAAMRALLATIGVPMKIREAGRWRQTFGWSEPRRMSLPAPLGRRRVYLYDAPDLDIFAERYAAGTVRFFAEVRPRIIGRLLALCAWLKRRGWLREPIRLAPAILRLARTLPQTELKGALIVYMRGRRGAEPLTRYAHLIVRDQSVPALVASAATALARKWVHKGVTGSGAGPCIGLIDLNDLKTELAGDDVLLRLS